jgi:hypothetical protein
LNSGRARRRGVGGDRGKLAWGALNSAVPVSWLNWLASAVSDEPEAGGGMTVAAIQLAIRLGAAFGGVLLDHFSVAATFAGLAALLLFGALGVGKVSPSRLVGRDSAALRACSSAGVRPNKPPYTKQAVLICAHQHAAFERALACCALH